jgi:hypothetical protein
MPAFLVALCPVRPAMTRLEMPDAIKTWMPGTRPGMAWTRGKASKIPEDLGPDGDHADEQRQRRERGGFLGYGFEHGFSPERKQNIVHYLFRSQPSASSEAKYLKSKALMTIAVGPAYPVSTILPSRKVTRRSMRAARSIL